MKRLLYALFALPLIVAAPAFAAHDHGGRGGHGGGGGHAYSGGHAVAGGHVRGGHARFGGARAFGGDSRIAVHGRSRSRFGMARGHGDGSYATRRGSYGVARMYQGRRAFANRTNSRSWASYRAGRNTLAMRNNRRVWSRGRGDAGRNWAAYRHDGRNNWAARSGRAFANVRFASWHARHRFHAGGYYWPAGYSYRHWSIGGYLPTAFFGERYWLTDYRVYDLPYAPAGAVWVRYGADALLIDRYSGEILEIVYGVFY